MKPLCVRCGKRRAARHCPALDAAICSRCCGEDRLVRIDCPPSCPHLEHNERFQKDKQRLRYREAWGRVNANLQGREADLRALLVLEGIVFDVAGRFKGITDADLAKALDDLHAALSPLELVKAPPGPLARQLVAEVDAFAQETGAQGVRESVDRIGQVLALMRDPTAPRAYLQGLAVYTERAAPRATRRQPSSGLIVTPDDLRRG